MKNASNLTKINIDSDKMAKTEEDKGSIRLQTHLILHSLLQEH